MKPSGGDGVTFTIYAQKAAEAEGHLFCRILNKIWWEPFGIFFDVGGDDRLVDPQPFWFGNVKTLSGEAHSGREVGPSHIEEGLIVGREIGDPFAESMRSMIFMAFSLKFLFKYS